MLRTLVKNSALLRPELLSFAVQFLKVSNVALHSQHIPLFCVVGRNVVPTVQPVPIALDLHENVFCRQVPPDICSPLFVGFEPRAFIMSAAGEFPFKHCMLQRSTLSMLSLASHTQCQREGNRGSVLGILSCGKIDRQEIKPFLSHSDHRRGGQKESLLHHPIPTSA